jgi:cytochrome c oxidase subunit 2
MSRIDAQRRQCMLAGGALALGALAAAVRAQPSERVIPVVARKFVFVPSEIRIKKGETVVLELSAPEVMMGFACQDLGLRSDIVPGRVTRLRITPAKVGSFAFLCDVFCGSGHEDMQGTLIVEA